MLHGSMTTLAVLHLHHDISPVIPPSPQIFVHFHNSLDALSSLEISHLPAIRVSRKIDAIDFHFACWFIETLGSGPLNKRPAWTKVSYTGAAIVMGTLVHSRICARSAAITMHSVCQFADRASVLATSRYAIQTTCIRVNPLPVEAYRTINPCS